MSQDVLQPTTSRVSSSVARSVKSKVFPTNFQFTDLLENFNCPNVGDFIFDNVTVDVQDGSASFSGELRMEGSLAPLKNYLGIDGNLELKGEIKFSKLSLNFKMEADSVSLSLSTPFFKEVFKGVTLTQAVFSLDFEKGDTAWSITPELSGELDIDGITDTDPGKLDFSAKLSAGVLSLDAKATALKGPFGLQALTLDELSVSGELFDAKSLNLSSKLHSGNQEFNFAGVVTPEAVGITAGVNTFTLNDLGDLFNEISPAQLSLPDFGVSFTNSSVALATADCTVKGKSIEQGLTLGSTIGVHGETIEATAQISPNGVVFDGSLSSFSVGPINVNKTNLDFEIYKKQADKPTKFEISGEVEIEGLTLDCGVYFEKNTTFTTVLYANIQSDGFGLGDVFAPAKGTFVDELQFSQAGFIYATADCTTKNESLNYTVQEGLNLMGVVKQIPGLDELTKKKNVGMVLSAHIGTQTKIGVALPDTRLDLGHSVKTDPFKIEIGITPTPELALIFGMDVEVPNQNTPLHFDMKLALGMIDASGSVTMKNYWKNPFGINGLKIGPAVAVELGINYPQFVSTGTPSTFGLAGGLEIGGTNVQMAVKVSENPTEEILMGKLEELQPADLINFATQMIKLDVPNVPDFFEIKELELYMAPTGGSIGTINYKQGFSFTGDVIIGGKEISMYTRISDNGIEGAGHIDHIKLGPLEITGEKGKDAEVSLALTTSEQAVSFDGAFKFLGFEEGLFLDVSNKGVEFKFEQDFFDLLKYEIQGKSSGSLSDPTNMDFQLSGEMDNDITSFLKNEVTKKIDVVLKEANTEIKKAEQDVDVAKAAYDKVYNAAQKELTNAQAAADKELKKLQGGLSRAKSDYTSSVNSAQRTLNNAKSAYEKAFDDAQDAVNSAQRTYNNGIKSAQNEVNNAQRTYNNGINSAQNAVNSAERAYNNSIGSAASAVRSAQRKVNGMSKWNPGYWIAKGALKAAELALEAVKYGAKYTAFTAAKAALQAAKTGANYTAFLAAKTALNVAKTGANYTAFMGAKAALEAVEKGGEYTAWKAAEGALVAAKAAGQEAIDLAQKGLNDFGRSAVSLALTVAKNAVKAVMKGSEFVAFNVAKGALKAAQIGASAALNAAKFIASHSGDIIDIQHMSFSGSLKEVEAGNLFDATLTGSVLSQNFDWDIDFDVKDVTGFIENAFDKAWDEIKSIVD